MMRETYFTVSALTTDPLERAILQVMLDHNTSRVFWPSWRLHDESVSYAPGLKELLASATEKERKAACEALCRFSWFKKRDHGADHYYIDVPELFRRWVLLYCPLRICKPEFDYVECLEAAGII